MKLLAIGKDPNLDSGLNAKIELSNMLALFFIAFSILNLLNFIIFVPAATIYPVVTTIASITAMLLNRTKQYTLSRLLLSFSILAVVFLYQATTHPAGVPSKDAIVLLAFSLSVTPFVLFRAKERLLMIISYLVNASMVALIATSNEWVSIKLDVDYLMLDSFPIQLVLKFTALTIMALIFFYFIQNNAKSFKDNSVLKEEVQQQNKELLASKSEMETQLKELEESRHKELIRTENAQALSKFRDILRDAENLGDVYDQAISFLVKSVKANQAGMYLTEEDENGEAYLKLEACYAYGRKKFIEQRIEIGQGLLGQAYLEKDKVFMTEIPQQYTRITSGLGDATPTSLLIIPMIYQEKVQGLLEIASFHVLEPHQIRLLEQACLTLGGEISAYRVQLRTQFLLEEAQAQTEQMHAQEEEMRQNMEEMMATQEAMQRKEQEMQALIKELEEKDKLLQLQNR